MEEMFKMIKTNDLSNDDLKLFDKLTQWLTKESFDSDAIKMDLNDCKNGIFYGNINQNQYGLQIPQLIHNFVQTDKSYLCFVFLFFITPNFSCF